MGDGDAGGGAMTFYPWSDTITVLRAQPGVLLAKTIAPDGHTTAYGDAKYYSAESRPVASVQDIGSELEQLLHQPDRCVVRGEPLPGANLQRMRRLAFRDAKTCDEPTLGERPRRVLALDFDSILRPDSVPAHDLAACADVVLPLLPQAFQMAACIIQATAGHGLKPEVRLRAWFYCARPMLGRELARWLRGCPIDTSVFRTVQPIYTATPVFIGGRKDHLPARILELPGEDWLRCPSAEELAEPPPAPETPPDKIARGKQATAYADAALADAADSIINAGEGARHETIVAQSRSLGRLVKCGMISSADVIGILSEAARRAGKTDKDEVLSCIKWGLANPSNAKLPESRLAA